MNPNGLVLAASTTSQTSISSFSHIRAISFTSPMFTARNVFSSSFTISATRGEFTITTRSIADEYSAPARREQSAVRPPTTFGTLRVVYTPLPGSTRSGENARKKSTPARRPPRSSSGCTSSSVVPGYVVDSRTMSMPECRWYAMASTADTMYDMSGSLVFGNGVGTQMLTVSRLATTEKSEVAVIRPASTIAATSADGTSGMYDWRALMAVTLRASRSIPTVV